MVNGKCPSTQTYTMVDMYEVVCLCTMDGVLGPTSKLSKNVCVHCEVQILGIHSLQNGKY